MNLMLLETIYCVRQRRNSVSGNLQSEWKDVKFRQQDCENTGEA